MSSSSPHSQIIDVPFTAGKLMQLFDPARIAYTALLSDDKKLLAVSYADGLCGWSIRKPEQFEPCRICILTVVFPLRFPMMEQNYFHRR
jgi:hypothetical protein